MCIFLLFFSNIVFAQISGKVIGIKDGDTVVILLEGNIQKTLRVAEVDNPENSQPFGKNAKQFTSDQIFGKQINFIETDTDRYGRTIAKIYYDNKYLSAEIIKSGFGWWYYHYSNDKNLKMLEAEASKNKIGLWSDPNSIPPWEWRKLN
ncbi:nuclease [Chryseobacterium sp. 5_R23647]|nr:nuclease [Chryseobacterium sp. 5_R23647]